MLCYSAINQVVLQAIPVGVHRVLDVGCGSGRLGAALMQRGNVQVVGITFSPEEAIAAAQSLTQVIKADLNTYEFADIGLFDCAVCSHVLEHLYDPLTVLKKVIATIRPGGSMIVALPNIEHWKPRFKIAMGTFEYTEGGFMDSTHFRFFDRRSVIGIVRDSGLSIERVFDDGYLPQRGIRSRFPAIARRIDRVASRCLPGLFSWQFVVTGVKRS